MFFIHQLMEDSDRDRKSFGDYVSRAKAMIVKGAFWIFHYGYYAIVLLICVNSVSFVWNVGTERHRLWSSEETTLHQIEALTNQSHITDAYFNIQNKYALIGMNDSKIEYYLPYDTGYTETTRALTDINGHYDIVFHTLSHTVLPFSFNNILMLAFVIIAAIIGFSFVGTIAKNTNALKDKYEIIISTNVRFSDVAGISEAKQKIQDVVGMIGDRDKYALLGAKIPNGILLTGKPGCGKTLLAKAVAGEIGAPFIIANGGEFDEKLVGVGADRVKKMYKSARSLAATHGICIVFIDEIDAIGRNRLASDHKYSDTLNVLLSELDGARSHNNVITFAATNISSKLDPALTRSGRFDHKIHIDVPNKADRMELFKLYLNRIQLTPPTDTDDTDDDDAGTVDTKTDDTKTDHDDTEVVTITTTKSKSTNDDETDKADADEGKTGEIIKIVPTITYRNDPKIVDEYAELLTRPTVGMTGADIMNVCNQAAMEAGRRDALYVELKDLRNAIETIGIGHEKKSRQASDEHIDIVAHHESGHALIGLLLEHGDSPIKMTIVPRADSLGYTMPDVKDQDLQNRIEIVSKMMSLLGGRAAERVIYGKITTGAGNDLQKVRKYAKQYFLTGMSGIFGNVYFADDYDSLPEITKGMIEKRISKLVEDLTELTEDILIEHKNILRILARNLLNRETIDFTQINETGRDDLQLRMVMTYENSIELTETSNVDEFARADYGYDTVNESLQSLQSSRSLQPSQSSPDSVRLEA